MPRRIFAHELACVTLSLGLVMLAACSQEEKPKSSASGGGGAQTQAGTGGAAAGAGSASMPGGSGGVAQAGAGGSKAPSAGAGGLGGSSGASAGTAGQPGAAGSTGGSAGSGTGGGAAYNPCPTNGDPCRVMPLGDSITDGVGSSHDGGYRPELFRLSLTNQKKLTFVGSGQSGPDKVNDVAFPARHEGHSGWTIDDGGGRSGLYPKIQGWLTATPPHIVTLMIGTNDIDIGIDVNNAPNRLGLLLDRISMYAPDALIVLAQMVPTIDNDEDQRVKAYNAAMPALVKTRADAGKHLVLVDMHGAFTSNSSFATAYMDDNLHPKDAGYVVMANTWWAVLGPLLK